MNPVVNVLDIDGIVQKINVNELAEKLDLNELIGKRRNDELNYYHRTRRQRSLSPLLLFHHVLQLNVGLD